MTLSALVGSGGIYHAPFAGDRVTVQAILLDQYSNIGDRRWCPHPERNLVIECCAPGWLRCVQCALADASARDCTGCCACGGNTPGSPAARAAAGTDLVLASGGGIEIWASFCAKCSRVARQVEPRARNARQP